MKILAVDSSSLVASCAVVEDEKLICQRILNNKLTHSQTLMPMIAQALAESELEISDIDLFVSVVGPGSFTGIRIGVSATKALAHSNNKPCIAVNTLEAMANNMPFCEYTVVPIMDARRNEVYTAMYDTKSGLPTELLPPTAEPIADTVCRVKKLGKKAVFLGDGVFVHRDYIKEELGDLAEFAPAGVNTQNATSAANLAKIKEQIGYAELKPVYLRKSQAEREREERIKNNE